MCRGELLALGKSGQRRGPHLLKHLFPPQVSYAFLVPIVDFLALIMVELPLSKEGARSTGAHHHWSAQKKVERFLPLRKMLTDTRLI